MGFRGLADHPKVEGVNPPERVKHVTHGYTTARETLGQDNTCLQPPAAVRKLQTLYSFVSKAFLDLSRELAPQN